MPKDNEGEEFQVKITTIYGPNSGHQNTFLGKKKPQPNNHYFFWLIKHISDGTLI